jgi:Ca-activated chloride channel family protein
MNKKNNDKSWLWLVGVIVLIIFINLGKTGDEPKSGKSKKDPNTFTIISSASTSKLDDEIIEYGKKNDIDIEIEHYGDLEIIEKLNNDSKDYDAVWLSNSIWLYMLNNSYLTTDSKSIVMEPVVMGIQKSKAEELGFVGKDIYNKDILEAIKSGKLKYVMSSVTQTNTGATAYFNFLNSLAGNPEVLTSDMLKDEALQSNLIDLFKGVERVSGDEDYLIDMYQKGDYNAMINYESSLIELNKKLVKEGKEPLYLVYPVDGVAINDMPFAYINNDSKNTTKKEQFEKLQTYLRSDTMSEKLQKLGYRAWYGGINKNADSSTFNKEWGIDTTKYLKDMKYPSKKVMTEAIDLYIDKFRKPTHVVFCLDISGSMSGDGIKELKDAMNYILNSETASKDNLQFSSKDKITIITFNKDVARIYDTKYGFETNEVIEYINDLSTGGSTNIYSPSKEALRILSKDSDDEYTKTVILMTDGASNNGTFTSLKNYYDDNHLNIPIYSITFGSSSETQLNEIAELTNGKVFDGKSGLKKAFKEVRSYN